MNTKKETAIQELEDAINGMANIVLSQLSNLEKIILSPDGTADSALESEIKARETELDNYEIEISDRFINIIVLFQPMAGDLRKIVAIYRLSINLERIGDLVINVTDTVIELKRTKEYKAISQLLNKMFLGSMAMVEKSLLSFTNNDMDYAIWTIRNDEIIDEMNRKLMIRTIADSNLDEKTRKSMNAYLELKNTISDIERIADHATNIAEVTIYNLKGKDVRHSDYVSEDQEPEG